MQRDPSAPTTPLNFGSYALRALSVLGATAVAFLAVASASAVYRDPPPVLAVIALTLVLVAGVSRILFHRFPGLLVVPNDTDSGALLVRLLVGGALSYVLLGLVVYVAGWVGIGILALCRGLEGEEAIAVAILTLYLPLWALPLSASVTAWWWTCRSRS